MSVGIEKNENVLPLFAGIEIGLGEQYSDPLQDLLNEAEAEAWIQAPTKRAERILVSPMQFPDQSLFILEKQLAQLNETMGRMRFYLTDLDDLLPR